jgi:hypothetical protein
MPWALEGTYLEACNCDAICPCRTVGGRPGGRSTHGECLGALSWVVTSGAADDVGLDGLAVVLVLRYSDDEPGSPWDYTLHVDDRGGEAERAALEEIFLGKRGGTATGQFPWVRKPANLLRAQASEIEIDHTPGRGWFRAGRAITVRVRAPVADQEPVTCLIPGHHREGTELHVDLIEADDPPLQWQFEAVCGYESTFAYSG